MKRIVIITDRKRIAEKIREDLLCVFRGKAELETLTFEEIAKMETVDGDLLLFTLDRADQGKAPSPGKYCCNQADNQGEKSSKAL